MTEIKSNIYFEAVVDKYICRIHRLYVCMQIPKQTNKQINKYKYSADHVGRKTVQRENES